MAINNKDGVELAVRFAYGPNILELCGTSNRADSFLRYLKRRDNGKEVKRILEDFEGMPAYLGCLAELFGRDRFDYDIVEAYWIGNELLDRVEQDNIETIIKGLMGRGLPPSIGMDLIGGLIQGLVPHHDFSVLYMARDRTPLDRKDKCRVSWGKIVDILDDNHLVVQTNPLLREKGEYLLGKEEPRTAVYLPEMLPDVSVGDHVALHWGYAVLKLTEEQLKNLQKYTGQIRNALNSQK